MGGCNRNTLKGLLMKTLGEDNQKIAVRYKSADKVVVKTYEELGMEVSYLGNAFLQLEENEILNIGIIGENSYEWLLVFITTMLGAGICIPLDKELPGKGLIDIINRTKITLLIVSNDYKDKINSIKDSFNTVKKIILMNVKDKECDNISIQQLITYGSQINNEFRFNEREIAPLDTALILFTSGTTSKSKGVMLNNKNLISNCLASHEAFRFPNNSIGLNVLPMHHIYAISCDIIYSIFLGRTLCISESLKYLENELQLYKPQDMFTVPLIANNLITNAFNRVKEVVNKKQEDIRIFFGGNIETIYCGGAAVDKETIRLYEKAGINFKRLYGTTECSPIISATFADKEYNDYYTVGSLIQCNKVKIINNEVLVKGDNVMMGYFENREDTMRNMDDEWFKTGDMGFIDQGNLYITGRKKNVIILSNGKNIYPEEIEEYIYEHIEVKECIVYETKTFGKKNGLGAIIFPNKSVINEDKGVNLNQIIGEVIKQVNLKFPVYKQILQYYVSHIELERTATGKIIRQKVIERVEQMTKEEKIIKLIGKYVDSELTIHIDSNLFNDLAIDSMRLFDLISEIEKMFHVVIPDPTIPSLQTIQDIIDYIKDRSKE